ncbi:MAG: hypothetical protein AVDCRST_MAG86-1799 [uncultured Truepera sp.]|uniref:HTH cro/C1-type domain-containing protein n=1 Tax=uncultured Truepera sp. TaxID=543023 RepID=A0A6J4V983_9DEIN|nr:MAG: hypothetical protein AVDCRST_MAG86-1799 [uncultured Truepera sp.]
MTTLKRPVGELLRGWRQRRRLSQLDLAGEADISMRHLSYLETGRSKPSRAMLHRLAERLDVPLRERNALLVAAGYAPTFSERKLDDPALSAARQAVDAVLAGHEPYPALAVDRCWNLVASNRAIPPLLAGIAPWLLRPPVNVLRLSLHPKGLALRILNLPEWRDHLLGRLQRQVDHTADAFLTELLAELKTYPVENGHPELEPTAEAMVVPLRLDTEGGTLSLISTTMLFGTPLDVTLSELALECFFPADAATADALRLADEKRKADEQPQEAPDFGSNEAAPSPCCSISL